jgi:hypothetical protein
VFDSVTLRVVDLVRAYSAPDEHRVLRVYFDALGAIRVVESYSPYVEGFISEADAIAEAAERIRLAGHDPSDGTIEVALGAPDAEWYVTFSRVIEGYPVANYPMAWGPDGDKAYVNLRATGELNELYYFRLGPLRPARPPRLPSSTRP